MPIGMELKRRTDLGNGYAYGSRKQAGSHERGTHRQVIWHVIHFWPEQAQNPNVIEVAYRNVPGQSGHFLITTHQPRSVRAPPKMVLDKLSELLGLEKTGENNYKKPGAAAASPQSRVAQIINDNEPLNASGEREAQKDKPPVSMKTSQFLKLLEELGYRRSRTGFFHPGFNDAAGEMPAHVILVNTSVHEIGDRGTLSKVWKLKRLMKK